MSFKVQLYAFSKKENSTAQPTERTPIEYYCVLRSGCSLSAPIIELKPPDSGTPELKLCTYAYIPAFHRYYFVTDWRFEYPLQVVYLEVDVLATYKAQIGNASLYVLRAADEYDGRIIDTMYPTKTECSYDYSPVNNPWQASCFVVGVISADAGFGSVEYYAMTQSELRSMCLALMDQNNIINIANGFNLTDFSQALQLAIVNPMQYVVSAMMLPVPVAEITNTDPAQTIKVLYFDAGTGKPINTTSRINKSLEFPIKEHPQTNSHGIYVNSSPYTQITLTIPPFGVIPIDTTVTVNEDKLYAFVEVDPITGKGILEVYGSGIILSRLEAQIGVPITLSQVTRDYIGGISSIAASAGSIAGGIASGMFGIGAIGALHGIGNAVEGLTPRPNTIGTTGTFAALHGDCRMDFQYFWMVDDDITHAGRPLCKVKQISSLSGYIIVQDGDVATTGTAEEERRIKSYLESGFYYE